MTQAFTRSAPQYTEDDLSAMTKAELLDMVESIGVEGVNSRNTKAEIISAIMNSEV